MKGDTDAILKFSCLTQNDFLFMKILFRIILKQVNLYVVAI